MKSFFDTFAFCLIFIGITSAWMGLHYFGSIAFWAGGFTCGLGILALRRSASRKRKMDEAMFGNQSNGDFGDTHYHQGAEHRHHDHSSNDSC